LAPTLFNSAPQVALFSSRGPDVKDFSFQDADVLKPDILAPGNLIWAAWAPNGTDEANYAGKFLSCLFSACCGQSITNLVKIRNATMLPLCQCALNALRLPSLSNLVSFDGCDP
jgi:hypothetical protein